MFKNINNIKQTELESYIKWKNSSIISTYTGCDLTCGIFIIKHRRLSGQSSVIISSFCLKIFENCQN